MSYVHNFEPVEPRGSGGGGHPVGGRGRPSAAQPGVSQTRQQVQSDTISTHVSEKFISLLQGYRASGGLLRAQMVASLCTPRSGTDVHTLAGWIIGRRVISFEWLSSIWLPMFQFNPTDMSRQSGLDEVLTELVSVHDGWEMANWFVQPNPVLGDALPADKLAFAATDVLAAARIERFVIAG